jgi:PhnB protein
MRDMAKAAQPVPPGFHTLTMHLTVRGCGEYIDFLKRAFSAVEIRRSPGPGGKLMHASVQIGDSILMLNDDFPEMGAPPIAEGNWPVRLSLWATATGRCAIRAGFVWGIATHIEDPTPEEIQQRMAQAFGASHS